MWIKVLEQDISPGQNAKQLAVTVAEIPSRISEAYSHELEKIIGMQQDEKERAVMIPHWVLYAIRPLQVKRLAEALVVSNDDLDAYPEDELLALLLTSGLLAWVWQALHSRRNVYPAFVYDISH